MVMAVKWDGEAVYFINILLVFFKGICYNQHKAYILIFEWQKPI